MVHFGIVNRDSELAWAAGLFEGEGSIVQYNNGGRPYLRLALRMTDEDVVRHFAVVANESVLGPYDHQQNDGHVRKPVWVCHVNGTRAARVLELFWPYLGSRRRARATELLSFTGYESLVARITGL